MLLQDWWLQVLLTGKEDVSKEMDGQGLWRDSSSLFSSFKEGRSSSRDFSKEA